MEFWSCATILFPALLAGGAGFLGGGYWAVSKFGAKAVFGYLLNIPTKLFGYALLAFRQKVTITLAFATAFRGTITTVLEAIQGTVTPLEVGRVLLGEIYRQTLLAPKVITQGLTQWIQFFTVDGVCTQIVSLDLLGAGFLNIWTGLSSVIILAFFYRLHKGYVQKQEVNREQTFMFIALVFVTSALIQIGVEQTQLYEVVEKTFSFLDILSGSIPETPVNESLNQSVNGSLNGGGG